MNFAQLLRQSFIKWKQSITKTLNLHPSILEMRMKILKLESELETLSNKDSNIALLAAERALNK